MSIQQADVATVRAWHENNEAVMIDVREDHEYEASRIPGAVHIPMSRFDVNELPVTDGKHLVFYCAMGMRSNAIAEQLFVNGIIDECVNMTGGISAWFEAQYPLEP